MSRLVTRPRAFPVLLSLLILRCKLLYLRVVQEATGQIESKMEKKIFDAKARTESLTPERRVEIARKAAQARWASKA